MTIRLRGRSGTQWKMNSDRENFETTVLEPIKVFKRAKLMSWFEVFIWIFRELTSNHCGRHFSFHQRTFNSIQQTTTLTLRSLSSRNINSNEDFPTLGGPSSSSARPAAPNWNSKAVQNNKPITKPSSSKKKKNLLRIDSC